MTQNRGPDGERGPRREPGTQLLPAPLVPPELAPATALAVAHQHRSTPVVEVMLGQRERLLDAQPGAPDHDNHRAQPPPVAVRAGVTHDGDDLVGGSAG